MNKVLVVGINGFVGKHLARELKANGHGVHGTGLDDSVADDISDLVDTYTQCDLTDSNAVAAIDLSDISAVINLAALATPSQSSIEPALYDRVNVLTHTNLLDRLEELKIRVPVVAVSTGAVYASDQPMPLTESSRLITEGAPYAMSKIRLEQQLVKYRDAGQKIITVRPLNHTGPGQGPGFIVPDMTSKIQNQDELIVGPLNTSRDYTHVDDVVRAYRLLIEQADSLESDVYNICSGVATSRDELIELIEKATGRPKLPVKIDDTIGRPNDPVVLYGSHDLLTAETGWKPEKNLEQTISEYVAWADQQNKQ